MRIHSYMVYMAVSLAISGLAAYRVSVYRDALVMQAKTIVLLKVKNAELKESNAKLEKQLQQKGVQLTTAENIMQQSLKSGSWYMQKGIATAYSPYDNISGIEADSTPGVTSIGLRPGRGIIAVDPQKIPYNSEMLVIYPDGHTQEGIAGDTGEALTLSRGVHIDMYKDTYSETKQHGTQDVTILWRPKKSTP